MPKCLMIPKCLMSCEDGCLRVHICNDVWGNRSGFLDGLKTQDGLSHSDQGWRSPLLSEVHDSGSRFQDWGNEQCLFPLTHTLASTQ